MQNAVAYVRVSSKDQVDNYSIGAQIDDIKEYAARNGYNIIDIYKEEGKSAYQRAKKRPSFQKMIGEVKEEPELYDALLVYKFDRFSRNKYDNAVYKCLLRDECDVDIISITEKVSDDPIGRLVEDILESVGVFYSANLGQEVLKGQTQRAKEGKANGEAPYGYIIGDNGKYEIYEPEADVVRYIFKEYLDGKGTRKIAQQIKEKGFKKFGEAVIEKANGKKLQWKNNRIPQTVINNEVYTGTFKWSDIKIEDNHPAIINKEDYELAQEMKKSRRGKGCEERNMYLLKGIMKCYECGATLGRKRKKYQGGHLDYAYCVGNRVNNDCYTNRHRIDKIEDAVVDTLEKIANDNIKINSLKIANSGLSKENKVDKLNKQLNNIDEQFDRQMQAFEAGVINLEQLQKYKERLNNEREELQEELERVKSDKVNIDEDKFKSRISASLEILKNSDDVQQKRRALMRIVKEVRASDKKNLIEIVYKW